ncbi:MAG: tyrosine-type recombinase/integrase, partial [Pirellulales bacterium]
VNGGLGNSDIGNMPLSAVDLQRGWINYPRPKTGIERRFPLWPETVEALKASLASRPTPKDDADKGLFFLTKYGQSWAKGTSTNPISAEFRKRLDPLGLHRPGLGFYALRHTFETVAGESRDQVAVNYIMGHAPAGNDMASVYRERISDKRLQAVTEHVRGWLFLK